MRHASKPKYAKHLIPKGNQNQKQKNHFYFFAKARPKNLILMAQPYYYGKGLIKPLFNLIIRSAGKF